MKIQFIQDISITALGGWKRAGEVLDTDVSLAQGLMDAGYAVAAEASPDSENMAASEPEAVLPDQAEVTDDATGETLLIPEPSAKKSAPKRKAKK